MHEEYTDYSLYFLFILGIFIIIKNTKILYYITPYIPFAIYAIARTCNGDICIM
jgi:hypothetical protein